MRRTEESAEIENSLGLGRERTSNGIGRVQQMRLLRRMRASKDEMVEICELRISPSVLELT